MSFEDIQKVTDVEQSVRAKKAEAQARARQLVADAHKSGAAQVERERADAEAQVRTWMAEEEAKAAERAKKTLAENEADCKAMREKAQERLGKAADLIVEKVVEL